MTVGYDLHVGIPIMIFDEDRPLARRKRRKRPEKVSKMHSLAFKFAVKSIRMNFSHDNPPLDRE